MIAAFYSNKSILITGATGFLGKVLMEKLFRTSPHLKVIYILVRPKSGQTLQERVFQILNSKVCLAGRALYDGQYSGPRDFVHFSLQLCNGNRKQATLASRGVGRFRHA